MIYTLTASFQNGIIANYVPTEPSPIPSEKKRITHLNLELTSTKGNIFGLDSEILPDLLTTDLFDADLSSIKLRGETGLLVSNRLAFFFNTLKTPITKAIPITLHRKGEISSNSYFYLVFKGTLLGSYIVPLSTFKIVERSDKSNVLKRLEGIDSPEKLSALQIEYRENGKMLLVETMRLKEQFDVWWGGDSQLYITSKVKNSLEEANFLGLDVNPFKKFNIVTIAQST